MDKDMAIKVVIADDHSLVRQGLRRYLEMGGDIEVVGEASNGREVLAMLDNGSGEPDVVLLDIRMPEMDGLEAARRIKQSHPSIGVIMLTAYDDRQFVVEAVRAGARGYVLKARDAEHLIQTVRLVAGGNMVIDPQLVVALRAGRKPAQIACAHSPSPPFETSAGRSFSYPVRILRSNR